MVADAGRAEHHLAALLVAVAGAPQSEVSLAVPDLDSEASEETPW